MKIKILIQLIRCKIYMIQYNHSVIGKQLHHTKITHGKKVCYDLYILFFCIYRLSCLLRTENASFGKMSICLGLFCSYLQRHQHFIISSYTICFSRTITKKLQTFFGLLFVHISYFQLKNSL